MNRARAFSLVEVLIGILILALGLLGLGAIIPVVVREQRVAADTALGIACANDAVNYLLKRPDLDPTLPTMTGWDTWLENNNWSSGSEAFLWMPWQIGQDPPEMDIDSSTGEASGNFTFSDAPDFYATIRLADRLWPSLSRQTSAVTPLGLDPHRPQFVWDFVGRRVYTQPGEPEKLQICLFVRRVDINIRLPRGNYPNSSPARPITLYDTLTERPAPIGGGGQLASQDYRVPVCANPPFPTFNSGAGSGLAYLPTGTGIRPNGAMFYSGPIFLNATFDPAVPNRIELPGINTSDNRYRLIAQVGQKIVDNLGNVYTVQPDPLDASTIPGTTGVYVEPPIPVWVADPSVSDPTIPGHPGAPNPSKIHQVIFTPQIPAAVRVVTITRPVP